MQDKVELKVHSVSEIVGNSEVGIVVLMDKEEVMQIAIVCDKAMKETLHMHISKQKVCNTMLADVLANILLNQVGYKCELIINDIVDGVYKAMIVNTETYQPVSLRASDAILMHIITKTPIYATMQLMKRQAVPVTAGSISMALPYNALSDKMLQDAMKSAVEQEKYEMASAIRDELKKRGKL